MKGGQGISKRALLTTVASIPLMGMGIPARRLLLGGQNSGPSLDINFLTGSLDSRITFTRASNALYFDITGTLQQAITNVPRFNYNPTTLQLLGLLVEQTCTNSIRNPRAEGSAPGTPGTSPTNWGYQIVDGLSLQTVGSGTESGIPYVDIRWFGTPTTTSNNCRIQFETKTQIATTAGQSWSGSVFVRLVAGSLTNVGTMFLELPAYDITPTFLGSATASFTPTTAGLATQRVAAPNFAAPTNTASISSDIGFGYTLGQAVDFTLRIGCPQEENTTFVSSPILPPAGTPAATTRSKDLCSMSVGSWLNINAGTFEVEWYCFYRSPLNLVFLQTNDGSLNNRMQIQTIANTSTIQLGNDIAGIVINAATTNANSVGQINKFAAAYTTTWITATNGSTGLANTGTQSASAWIKLNFCSNGVSGNLQFNDHIRHVQYWPRALANNELQKVTTV